MAVATVRGARTLSAVAWAARRAHLAGAMGSILIRSRSTRRAARSDNCGRAPRYIEGNVAKHIIPSDQTIVIREKPSGHR